MASYYRVIDALSSPKLDLQTQVDYQSMSPAQLAALINNNDLPVCGMTHQTTVISSRAHKCAKGEWRRRNRREATFAPEWAKNAHAKAYK